MRARASKRRAADVSVGEYLAVGFEGMRRLEKTPEKGGS